VDLDTVFLVCNFGVMPAWALLIVAPNWAWTQRIVHAMWIPLVLGTVYAVGFVTGPPAPEGASFGTLEGVMLFMSVPGGVLVGWVHYLAFDLFVGAWEVRDARRRGVHHGFVIPCLALTLMMGPIGLALYGIVRLATGNGFALEEVDPQVA
jgi:hypothetical protein